jgi:Uma2 family endonuclease
MVSAPKRRATYQDVLDAPEGMNAEIINGELVLSPRPSGAHTRAGSTLGFLLGPPFDFGTNGPGGWILLDEPELHFGEDILIPDMAGWRVERMPVVQDAPYITLAPDWICELLSPSTEARDRADKLAIYAAAGVRHAWLTNARQRMLEVRRLHEGKWLDIAAYRGDVRVRAAPFDAIEIDLSVLWARISLSPPLPSSGGSRASEPAGEYVP